jgi:hypothetical protein
MALAGIQSPREAFSDNGAVATDPLGWLVVATLLGVKDLGVNLKAECVVLP